jgi:hypothetical protein
MKYEIISTLIFLIFNSSFLIEILRSKISWASRFASLASGYPLHHPHSRYAPVAGGFASIPLASWRKKKEKRLE